MREKIASCPPPVPTHKASPLCRESPPRSSRTLLPPVKNTSTHPFHAQNSSQHFLSFTTYSLPPILCSKAKKVHCRHCFPRHTRKDELKNSRPRSLMLLWTCFESGLWRHSWCTYYSVCGRLLSRVLLCVLVVV